MDTYEIEIGERTWQFDSLRELAQFVSTLDAESGLAWHYYHNGSPLKRDENQELDAWSDFYSN